MQALPRLGCCQGFKIAFCSYCRFSGRARRSEYWWFKFVYGFIFILVLIPVFFIQDEKTLKKVLLIVDLVYSLVFFFPNLAVTIRRLHDTGRSGWFILLSLIPIIGYFIILYFTLCDSEELTNEYGPSPKYYHPKSSFLENSKYYQMSDYSH